MMGARFSASDLARLGEAARRQIAAADLARGIAAEMRANKFGAVRTELDGVKFDSKAEADRFAALKLEERAGLIVSLQLQPVFPITINGNAVAEYRADFAYLRGAERVVEDVKGHRTPVYRLKKKLVEALYGFRITEIQA